MCKNVFFLLILIILSSNIIAQDWNEIYYLDGEAEYLVEEKKYNEAIDIYNRIIREIPEHSYAKYKIGLLYLKTDDQKNKAIKFLEEASEKIALDFNEKSLREIRTPVDVLLYLGQAYQIANRIDEAIATYNKFKGSIKPENELYPVVEHRLKTCENAKIALNNPLRVTKTNLGEPLNDDNSNFGAVISSDGNTIIFTSYTRNYIDNFYSAKVNGVWSTPKRISEDLSSKFYLRTVSLSYDGSQLYLATDDPGENDLFVCYKEGNSWTEADKLDKTINGKKSNETHASVSKDGNTLYFTSDREGGLGGIDIYKSTKDAKGKWGEPENLGPSINTPFDEATPFLTLNDKYLFFSSQGHNSIGGFDVFYIDLESNSQAINLGYPANTPGDEIFFVPDNSLNSGYISEYDNTSIGKNDIYHISILPEINFAGKLKNSATGDKITDSELKVIIKETETQTIIETLNISNGNFQFEIDPGSYEVFVSSESFDSITDIVKIPEDYAEGLFNYEAVLTPVAPKEELIAEVVEEPGDEQVQQIEEIAEEATNEEIKHEPEPVVEATIETEEKIKPEPEIQEKPVEPKKEIQPQKEIEKYVPKTSVPTGKKTYSVQLMALKNPVEVDYFKNIENVILTKYPDGLYRYTVGNTQSYSKAQELQAKIHELGYKNTFIRVNNESVSNYTIQIMALIIPVKPEHFENLTSVVVTKGADDYFRYTIGSYNSYEEAKDELAHIKSLGYNQAFIKRTN